MRTIAWRCGAGLLAIIACPVHAQGTTGPILTGTRLELSERGEVARMPDLVTISAGVVTQAVSARAAIADNATRIEKVTAALVRAGIANRDIATARLSLQPQYRYAENQPPIVTGYQASNTLSIRFRDVSNAGTILDTLVTNGVNQIDGPTFSVDKPETSLNEARSSAMARLRTRAALYARLAGTTVKRVVELAETSEAPFVRPMMAMARAELSDARAKTQILPGEETIGVTVRAVFELN